MCNMCLQKKYIGIIYPLSRIHNTSLTSAYFGRDNRECVCLEYYLSRDFSDIPPRRSHFAKKLNYDAYLPADVTGGKSFAV
jgi:hypothetical protein